MDVAQALLMKPTGPGPEEMLRIAARKTDTPNPAQTAEQLRDTAQQFETIFLHQILKQMKESVNYASLDEEDESGEQIQSMYWSFMADHLGQQGGLGFWKNIYEDLAVRQGIDLKQFPAESSGLDERA